MCWNRACQVYDCCWCASLTPAALQALEYTMTVNFSKHCTWILSKVRFSGSFNRFAVRSGNEFHVAHAVFLPIHKNENVVSHPVKEWNSVKAKQILDRDCEQWYTLVCVYELFLYQNLSTVPEVRGVQIYWFQWQLHHCQQSESKLMGALALKHQPGEECFSISLFMVTWWDIMEITWIALIITSSYIVE